jgi:hypothetical protein
MEISPGTLALCFLNATSQQYISYIVVCQHCMWWETGVPGEISILPQVIAQLKEKLYRVHLATRCN